MPRAAAQAMPCDLKFTLEARTSPFPAASCARCAGSGGHHWLYFIAALVAKFLSVAQRRFTQQCIFTRRRQRSAIQVIRRRHDRVQQRPEKMETTIGRAGLESVWWIPVARGNVCDRILSGQNPGQNQGHKSPKNILTSFRFCGLIVMSKIKPNFSSTKARI